MNLMRPGSLSQIAVILRMEHISKAGRARSSFVGPLWRTVMTK